MNSLSDQVSRYDWEYREIYFGNVFAGLLVMLWVKGAVYFELLLFSSSSIPQILKIHIISVKATPVT